MLFPLIHAELTGTLDFRLIDQRALVGVAFFLPKEERFANFSHSEFNMLLNF